MKLLLVADKDTTRDILSSHLQPCGFDVIHYRHPIKAMDNIEEIEPDVVVFSAEDFPRHWKPFIKLLRETRTKGQTAFVLLTGESFSYDEAAKATHLEVHGVIRETLDDRSELRKLDDIITRYGALRDGRGDLRYVPDDADNVEFLITHPTTYRLITGTLYDLSPAGAAFVPDDPKASIDIPAGVTIAHCSLMLDDLRLSLACKVIRNSGRMALRFVNTTDDVERAIIDYIHGRAERELALILHDR